MTDEQMKPTDKKLREMIDIFGKSYLTIAAQRENKEDFQAVGYKQVADALQELLTLRAENARLKEEKRELIENSERLANEVEIFCNEAGHDDINGVLKLNTALMARMKGE